MSGGIVWSASQAAFTATTQNQGASFAAGTVVLSDDDSGSAMFAAGDLGPGDSTTRCLTVRYDGTLPGTVRLFASPAPGALAPHLQVTVDEGSGGSGTSCAGYSRQVATLAGVPLADVSARFTDYATGTGSWGVTGPGQQRRYRVTVTLDPAAPDTVQGPRPVST